MDKRIKFGYRQKLLTVRSIMSGRESCISAAKKIGSKKNTVQRWVILYKQHGRQGLQLRNGSYDGNFKVRVVRYMLENKLSFRRTAVIFQIPQDCVLSRWLKIYEHLGAEGLLKESRGRKKSQMNKKTQKKKKGTSASKAADESVISLQREVEYLRAENAFLKKLDALIQQETAAKAQSKQQKPSRN